MFTERTQLKSNVELVIVISVPTSPVFGEIEKVALGSGVPVGVGEGVGVAGVGVGVAGVGVGVAGVGVGVAGVEVGAPGIARTGELFVSAFLDPPRKSEHPCMKKTS